MDHVKQVGEEVVAAMGWSTDRVDRVDQKVAVWPPAWLRETPRLSQPAQAPESSDCDLLALVSPDLPPPRPAIPREAVPVAVLPPAGVRLFFSDDDGRPCKAEDSFMWCWEGGPRWFYTSKNPPPPSGLTLRSGYPARCPSCAQRSLRTAWQTFSNGAQHLRCECAVCGRFIKHLKPPPANVDLEYRQVAGGSGM